MLNGIMHIFKVKNGTGHWIDVNVYRTTNATYYSARYEFPGLRTAVTHQFRIVLYRDDDGKWIKSVPGPTSEAVVLYCSRMY